MNSFIVILGLGCLAAVTFATPAQDLVVDFTGRGRIRCSRSTCPRSAMVNGVCPAITCPPRVPSANCGAPNCNIVANRAWHHPHPDPNFFYQCAPYRGDEDWQPIAMPCACGTLFVSERNCCQHPHDWKPECPGHVDPPTLVECDEDCGPNCTGAPPVTNPPVTNPPVTNPPVTNPPVTNPPVTNPPVTNPPSPGTDDPEDTPATPNPTTPNPTTLPPNGNCPCICIPCIFWPCQPCTASRTGCPCSQNQNQQQRPQPLPEQPRDNPWARPEQPRQPPTQWIPEAPRQPEWQPPRLPQQPPRIPQQPPTDWQQQPPHPWQPQPPQNNPWQRPFAADEEAEELVEEVVAEDEAL